MDGALQHGLRGRVVRLGAKARVPGGHGLPKPEVLEATIEVGGVVGDYNRYRQAERAGDPEMALLLLPTETIERFRQEGWPVAPGDLGENVTTAGVPYESLAPGAEVRFGSVVARTSKACTPCDNLYLLPYVGREKGPAFLKAALDRRGWYARVVRAGTVRKGDPLEVLRPPR